MKKLFKNIGTLYGIDQGKDFLKGKEMSTLNHLKDAYFIVKDGLICEIGEMQHCPQTLFDQTIDARGRSILPGWCDSHTHLVYAGDRSGEFVDRIKGLSYQEIAQKGGGILNSARKLQAIEESDLYEQSAKRLEQIIAMGTTAVEIKSGYGLTLEAELKMLRVIRKLRESYPISIKATYLAAHALPLEFADNKSGYIDLAINEWIPEVAKQGLAEYIDVFCEKGYFNLSDTKRILEAGLQHGLKGKIHVNQFNAFGAVELGVKHNALSVDHLEELNQEDIEALKGSQTMPVALPGCSHFLSIPYTQGRKMIDQGLPLALATDYNPGSAPSGNMNFVLSEACVKMKLLPEEAINAATLNGAYAMGLEKEVGTLAKGKQANFLILEPGAHLQSIPYSFGRNVIDEVWVKGVKI